VREPERLLGKKKMKAEVLKEAAGAEPLKKTAVALELAQTGRFQVKAVAQAMGWQRQPSENIPMRGQATLPARSVDDRISIGQY
jgi:hypothetical protein